MSIFSNYLKKSLFVMGLLLIQVASVQTAIAASDDDYLKQLEMEASDDPSSDVLDAYQSGEMEDTTILDAPSSDSELILDKKELIVDVKSFEKALKDTYPESFALYQQLTDEQKKQIYQHFTQNKRLYNSSVKVISVYLGTH